MIEHPALTGVFLPGDANARLLVEPPGGRSEREDRDADQPHGAGYPVLALAVRLSDHDGRGEELDHRVQAEPDQGDGGGSHADGDRDGGLTGHPGHACVFKPESAPATAGRPWEHTCAASPFSPVASLRGKQETGS
jgi:hypothetical protein